MTKYAIGIDYGTLSGRAVLVDMADGREVASASMEYRHAVIEGELNGVPLGRDWALQDPADYLEVLETVMPRVIAEAGIDKNDIVGVGVDFTSSTLIPVKADGTPLCFLDEFKNEPFAYAKLWKDHSANAQAIRISDALREAAPERLARYGGNLSSEWTFPKLLHIADEAPHVYDAADRFIEAGDWLVWMLTGQEIHSECHLGFKALWSRELGFVPNEFWGKLNPRMKDIIGTKVSEKTTPVGVGAGYVTAEIAARIGLPAGIPVATDLIDAHAAFPACGVTKPGTLLLIVGTSGCHLLLGDSEKAMSGICAVTQDTVIPGFYTYEAAQAAVGDVFSWFVKNCVPAAYKQEAEERGMNIHALLREKARRLKVGESGLVALDWWNGNRCVLQDSRLSGLIVGLTLSTKPEEIYRALLESTAYGTRRIIENFEENGVEIRDVIACGGIAMKDDLIMQIYADVTRRTIRLAKPVEAMAVGSAICGAAASGMYKDIHEAAAHMGHARDKIFTPNADDAAVYDKLYDEYRQLHDYFGIENDMMKRLKNIRED
ncbi:MAG: ribulokinase [Clostridia bacterium]|nr:ribulokinase [Clostridia bacterium]